MGHYDVASELRTLCEHALRAIAGDFVFEVHLPAELAELMAAAQLVAIIVGVTLLEFHIHHAAHI